MLALVLVSLLWAFSFGLTKGNLAGLDPAFVSAGRLGFALLVFLPFWRPARFSLRTHVLLAVIGAGQFGLMYLAYNAGYRTLSAYEVALLTLTTPLFVVAFDSVLARRWQPWAWVAAFLALGGGLIVTLRGDAHPQAWQGVLWVQLANVCFAGGPLAYVRVRRDDPQGNDAQAFATLYLGACLLTFPLAAEQTPAALAALTWRQGLTLAYLGLLASGLGFFFWNYGARRVSAAQLAVMNNAKVPLSVAVSLFLFGERADPLRLGAGFVFLGLGLLLVRRR